MLLIILTCLSVLTLIESKHMDGFIVGGNHSVIEDFPHVVFLHIRCKKELSSTCGASIVNQVVLLTAAHCVHDCKENFTIKAYTGNVKKFKGHEYNVVGFRIHEKYNRNNFVNDIAMLILKDNIIFGKGVQRITLVNKLPKYEKAMIAGWGWIDDESTRTDVLMHTSQKIWSYEECLKQIPGIPYGTICGYNPSGSHPQRGDSGSALVIKHHVQIGLASFFRRNISNKTLIYTDVPYFYNWIKNTATSLFCQFKNKNLMFRDCKCWWVNVSSKS